MKNETLVKIALGTGSFLTPPVGQATAARNMACPWPPSRLARPSAGALRVRCSPRIRRFRVQVPRKKTALGFWKAHMQALLHVWTRGTLVCVIYIYTHIYIYICTHKISVCGVSVSVCVCVCVCMYVCRCRYVYVCMYVCMYVRVFFFYV